MSESSAVIHTLGILLEDAGYKKAIRDGDVWGLMKAFSGLGSGSGFGGGNPLASGSGSGGGGEGGESSYEGMNRDSGMFSQPLFPFSPGGCIPNFIWHFGHEVQRSGQVTGD